MTGTRGYSFEERLQIFMFSHERAQLQTPSPFFPLSPGVLQKVHLQAVKCNRASTSRLEQDDYDDVEPVQLLSKNTGALGIPPTISPFKPGSWTGEEVYDDVDVIPDEFPEPPPEISLQNDSRPSVNRNKNKKKEEKEEKEFRKKFKYEGDIKVIAHVMVNPKSSFKKGSGKDLSLKPGEILEVIEYLNEKKALCRNDDGKYGFAPRSVLLQHDIYDDVDYPGTEFLSFDYSKASTSTINGQERRAYFIKVTEVRTAW
ncbi:uncharacterized protein [Heptranchias perlo]|uniref:uncharacterized protein n=1 Tax=Heptranchias perlo TaxID=212740 RepID=UPI003559BCB3